MTTFVLIHGAYQGGWIWKPVAEHLRAQGHLVLAPSLDGCAERKGQLRAGITTETHAAEDRRSVVLPGPERRGAGRHLHRRHGDGERCRTSARSRGAVVFADALALLDGEALPDIVKRPTAVDGVGTGPSRQDFEMRLFAGSIPPCGAGRSSAARRIPSRQCARRSSWSGSGQAWNASVIWCKQSTTRLSPTAPHGPAEGPLA
jgi:hypothetical protein